jgi:hypothetical protein
LAPFSGTGSNFTTDSLNLPDIPCSLHAHTPEIAMLALCSHYEWYSKAIAKISKDIE